MGIPACSVEGEMREDFVEQGTAFCLASRFSARFYERGGYGEIYEFCRTLLA